MHRRAAEEEPIATVTYKDLKNLFQGVRRLGCSNVEAHVFDDGKVLFVFEGGAVLLGVKSLAPMWADHPSAIIAHLKNKRAKRGEDVILRVAVLGRPSEFVWFHDRCATMITGGPELRLVAEKERAGEYHCCVVFQGGKKLWSGPARLEISTT